MVKIAKYIGFCVYRRSYLIWSPVILLLRTEHVVQVLYMDGFNDHAGYTSCLCTKTRSQVAKFYQVVLILRGSIVNRTKYC